MRVVRSPFGRPVAAACLLSLAVLLLPATTGAQDATRLNVRVGGDFKGTSIDLEPAGGTSVTGSHPHGTAESGRTVSFGGEGQTELKPGIYRVRISKGFSHGSTFVYVGPGQSKTLEVSPDGLPQGRDGIVELFHMGQQAKRLCQLATYNRALDGLRRWLGYYEATARDLKRALDEFIASGAFDGVPNTNRARLGELVAAGVQTYELGDYTTPLMNASGPGAQRALTELKYVYDTYRTTLNLIGYARDYIEKLQPPPDCPKRTSMYRDTLQPIQVGAKDAVGCDAQVRQEVVGGLLGGLGGFGGGGITFGGGGGSRRDSPVRRAGSGGSDLTTEPDPVAADRKSTFMSKDGAVKLSVGTTFADNGLWVSANVLDAPCRGTFQTIYLQDPTTGKRAGPVRYRITELYRDWWLTVNWTKDTYLNGQHVKHEEGGWSDSGRDILGRWTTPAEGNGVWKSLGFGTAVAGARGVAAYFPIPQELFIEKPLDVVVHVTRPDQDPVVTVPFGFESFSASPKLATGASGTMTGITGPLDGFGTFAPPIGLMPFTSQ